MPFFAQINAHFGINPTILYSGLFSPIWHTCFARLSFSQPGVSCLCGQKHIYVLNVNNLCWLSALHPAMLKLLIVCWVMGWIANGNQHRSFMFQFWQLPVWIVALIFLSRGPNIWYGSCKSLMPSNKLEQKLRPSSQFSFEHRETEGPRVGGLCGTGVVAPPYKSSGTKNLPHLSAEWCRGPDFLSPFFGAFSSHFWAQVSTRPLLSSLVDRSPHFGPTLATSELGPDWASFPRVGLRPDIGFSNIPAPDNLL